MTSVGRIGSLRSRYVLMSYLSGRNFSKSSFFSCNLRASAMQNLNKGLLPGVFTPLNDDHTVNYDAIPPYARYLQRNGLKAILVGGTTSENMCLNVSERKEIIDAWLATNKRQGLGFHIMVQVGGTSFDEVISLTKYCARVGVDSIMTLPELYFKPKTVEDLVSFIEQVANVAKNLPLFYYHSPDMTGVQINMLDFATAATRRVPSFKGIKFASTDLAEAAEVKWVLKEDQVLFIAGEILLAPAALLGIEHCSSSGSNIFPLLDLAILEAVRTGDVERARGLQRIVITTIKKLQKVEGDWIAVAKAATECVSGGLNFGPPCLPKRAISPEAVPKIRLIVDEATRLSAHYSVCLAHPYNNQ